MNDVRLSKSESDLSSSFTAPAAEERQRESVDSTKTKGSRLKAFSQRTVVIAKGVTSLANQSLKQIGQSKMVAPIHMTAQTMHLFGLGNLAKGAGYFLIKKIISIFRQLIPKHSDMKINSPDLSFPERSFRVKSFSEVDRKDIYDLLFISSDGNMDKDKNFKPEDVTNLLPRPLTAVLSDGTGQSLEDTRAKLRDTLLAFQTVRQKHGISLTKNQAEGLAIKTEKLLNQARALAAEGKSTETVNTQLEKLYMKALDTVIEHQNIELKEQGKPVRDAKKIITEFKSQIATMRGRHVPSRMIHHVHVPYNGQTIRYTEQTKIVNTDLSAQYLKNQGLNKQAEFARAQKGGIRPSAMKTEVEAQGTPISGNIHVVKNEKGEVIEWTARSGAWATHGRDPKNVGSQTLEAIAVELEESSKESRPAVLMDKELKIIDILKKKYLSDPKNKEKPLPPNFDAHVIDLELKERTALTTAQALPLVYDSLKMLVSQKTSVKNALKAGSFLHMEQSLLSDLVSSERAMIEDMAHAIKNLNKNVSIKFVEGPVDEESQMQVDDQGKITLQFSLNDVHKDLREEVKNRPLGLTMVFFTQGLNEQQSLGALKGGKSQLQEDINKQGINDLVEYETKLMGPSNSEAPPITNELVKLWNKGAYKFKDTALINKLNEVVSHLGGGKGVVCKSGKDRTGSEVNTINRLAIENDLKNRDQEFEMDENTRTNLKDSLSNGPSYAITRQGTDRAGYAFNDFQAGTFPEGIDIPDNRFFGSGAT